VCIFVVLGGIVRSGGVKMADDKVNNREYLVFTYGMMDDAEIEGSQGVCVFKSCEGFLGTTGHRSLLWVMQSSDLQCIYLNMIFIFREVTE
jgi:hypothetical protein